MPLHDFALRRKQQLAIKDHRVDRFILFPEYWNAFTWATTLSWTRLKFHQSSVIHVPNNLRGVYTFVAEPGVANHPSCNYLLYVGMVEDSNFRTRFSSYLAEPNKFKPREHVLYMIDRWRDYLWFYYSPLDPTFPAKTLEDALITAFLPPVNRNWPAAIRDVMKLVFS